MKKCGHWDIIYMYFLYSFYYDAMIFAVTLGAVVVNGHGADSTGML
jgi:hypothetical protein